MEIAMGVSDLDVFTIVQDHGGELWLRQDLHAKYFRGDANVLVGSANLTNSALGWSAAPNLELMLPLGRQEAGLDAFEEEVFGSAILVDEELYSLMKTAAADWIDGRAPTLLTDSPPGGAPQLLGRWVPLTRNPADLFKVYSRPESDDLPTLTREAGESDLLALEPPRGLEAAAFGRAIGLALLTMPVISDVDKFVLAAQRFGAVRDFLAVRLETDRSGASRAWQTIIRWLMHFLPDRYKYERGSYSEVISRTGTPPM